MGEERRKSKRIAINVTISLSPVNSVNSADGTTDAVSVNIIDISKTGMCFVSDHQFISNSFHDAAIVLDNKEMVEVVIEILRIDRRYDSVHYGCRFVGISPNDQFKIGAYRIVAEGSR